MAMEEKTFSKMIRSTVINWLNDFRLCEIFFLAPVVQLNW